MITENERKNITKQTQFLNRWAINYLKDKRSCNHKIVTQFTENRLVIYVKCADCGRFIKLRKQ